MCHTSRHKASRRAPPARVRIGSSMRFPSRLDALIGMGDRLEWGVGELDLAVKSEVEAHDIDGLPDLIEGDVSSKQGRHLGIEAADFHAHRIDCARFASSRSE